MRTRWAAVLALLLLALPLLSACGGAPADGSTGETARTTDADGTAGDARVAGAEKTITVGSKDFTEQILLGELYAQALEARGYTVNRKLGLGSVEVLDQALISRQIDMYPEYTGTTLEVLIKHSGEAPETPDETYQIVKEFYANRTPSQTLLKPTRFNNTNGVVVRREIAQRYNLKTLEDLAQASPNLIFASFEEFQRREDSFPHIKANYPEMNFKEILLVDTIDLRYKALNESRADVSIGFTTDGQIASQDLVVLEDTKNIWPFYYPAPVVDSEFLRANPEVEGILNAVSDKLDAPTMQFLNATVDVDREEPAAVAAKFLMDNGLR